MDSELWKLERVPIFEFFGFDWMAAAMRVKVGNFSRDMSLASGTQAITGVGFKPASVIFIAALSSATPASWGVDDGTNTGVVFDDNFDGAGIYGTNSAFSILMNTAAGVYYEGKIQSFDTDGFTITWTKLGATTGTATIFYLAFGT